LGNLVAALDHYRFPGDPLIEELLALLGRANEAEGKRNRRTHAVWAVGDAPDSVTRMKADAKKRNRGYHFVAEQTKPSDIDAVATEIAEIAEAVLTFYTVLMVRCGLYESYSIGDP
jgi:hypothetical protein